jgi:hypothetical protein
MRWRLLVLLVVGCGHHGASATGGGADDDATTVDASSSQDDGGGGEDGAGGVGDDGSGGSGDDTVETNCAAPIAPSVTLSVTSSNGGPGLVFRAGDQILAKPVIDETHTWLRWTPGGWSAEPIPWPSNLPTIHDHYISRVVQLASTRALIITDDHWLMTYDGTTMSPAIQQPATGGTHVWGFTQDAAGAYHVFWGVQEWISKPDGTWYPPAPVPIPLQGQSEDDVVGAAAIMRSGRVVVLYLDANFDAPARHAHLLSRGPSEPWTDETDITPTWAVNAQTPQVYTPPGGGIVLNVTGASTSYLVPVLWRSTDGVTVGNYEMIGIGGMYSFAGECLDSLIISGSASSSYDLLERQGMSWVPFASHPADSVYTPQVAVAALANGKTYWVLGKFTGTDYLVSP